MNEKIKYKNRKSFSNNPLKRLKQIERLRKRYDYIYYIDKKQDLDIFDEETSQMIHFQISRSDKLLHMIHEEEGVEKNVDGVVLFIIKKKRPSPPKKYILYTDYNEYYDDSKETISVYAGLFFPFSFRRIRPIKTMEDWKNIELFVLHVNEEV